MAEGWKTRGRDIGWAEAIGFELLVRSLIGLKGGSRFIVYGDNQGVVEGWANGRSRNVETNSVFRRVHDVIETHQSSVVVRYVPSANNPADGPSRGIFPTDSLLLPPMDLPEAV